MGKHNHSAQVAANTEDSNNVKQKVRADVKHGATNPVGTKRWCCSLFLVLGIASLVGTAIVAYPTKSLPLVVRHHLAILGRWLATLDDEALCDCVCNKCGRLESQSAPVLQYASVVEEPQAHSPKPGRFAVPEDEEGKITSPRLNQQEEVSEGSAENGGWIFEDLDTISDLPIDLTRCSFRAAHSEAVARLQNAEPFVTSRPRRHFVSYARRLSRPVLERRGHAKLEVVKYSPFSDWSRRNSVNITIHQWLQEDMRRLEPDEAPTERRMPFLQTSLHTLLDTEGATEAPRDMLEPGTDSKFTHDIYPQPLHDALPLNFYTTQVAIEGPGGGLPFHQHSAFMQEVLWGQKLAIFTPPGEPPAFNPRANMLRWVQGDGLANISYCVVRPGDIIFIPHNWWHAFISLGESVAVTKTFPKYSGNDRFHRGPMAGVDMRGFLQRIMAHFATAFQDGGSDSLEEHWEQARREFATLVKRLARYSPGWPEFDAFATTALLAIEAMGPQHEGELKPAVLKAARAWGMRALKLNPHWGPAWVRLARTHALLGDMPTAKEALQRGVDLGEKPPSMRRLLQPQLPKWPEFWQTLYESPHLN